MMILPVLIAMVAGWMQRHQQRVITSLQEENRILTAHLDGRRLRLTDTEHRRLAALAHPLGRTRLKEIAAIATPDTLLRWYKQRIAQKFDGRTPRRQRGRPRVAETERHHQGLANQLIVREGAVGCQTSPVVRREHLGGRLSYDHREAA